jgi:hypothetical protein
MCKDFVNAPMFALNHSNQLINVEDMASQSSGAPSRGVNGKFNIDMWTTSITKMYEGGNHSTL